MVDGPRVVLDEHEERDKERRKALSRDDLVAFLAYLRKHKPALLAPVMLQGLAGMRGRPAGRSQKGGDGSKRVMTVTTGAERLIRLG